MLAGCRAVDPQSRLIPRRKRGAKVSSTTSPLANPQTPIHRLAARVQEYLYFPDPSPLYAVCGCVAANVMRGYPVWLMLIAPASGGKTDLLKPLLNLQGVLDGIRECGDLSSKAALLSGVKKKDMAAGAHGGLLRELPKVNDISRGLFVMLDFARTILAADPAAAKSILGALGILHDGHYEREVGTEGGRLLTWDGRIGFIAACTDAIDQAQSINAEMGERCLYYRYAQSDGYHETNAALRNPDSILKDEGVRSAFLEWAAEMDFHWDTTVPPRELGESEVYRINALANLCARGRSGVDRDKFSREITGVRKSELGPRVALGLAQLLRGMEHVGTTSAEAWKVIKQVAMDSIPVVRSETLLALRDGAVGTSELCNRLRLSMRTTGRVLEDLELHDLVEHTSPNAWQLSAWAKEHMGIGWGESNV